MILRKSKVPEILLALSRGPQHVRGLQSCVGGSASTIQLRIRELLDEGLICQEESKSWPYQKILKLTEDGREMVKLLKLEGGFLTAARKATRRTRAPRDHKKWILALLYAMGGEIKGSIRMQKLLFLLGKEFGIKKLPYKFSPFLFGPFSDQVLEDVEDLVDSGLVESHREILEVRRPMEDSMVRCNYKLTPEGRKKAMEIFKTLSSEEREAMLSLRRFNEMELGELLGYVYSKYPRHSRM